MKDYNLILYISQTDIINFNQEQIYGYTQYIIDNIKVNKLEKETLRIIEDLSGVAEPRLEADMNYIGHDNQKRLAIINQLVSNLQLIKKDIKNLKKKATIDEDYILSFLMRMKEICNAILKYGILKSTEVEEQRYQPNALDILNGITTLEQKKKLTLKQKEKQEWLEGGIV